MNKQNALNSAEIIDFIKPVPFETYNSFPKILFKVKGKVAGKKGIFEGIMKIVGEKKVEFTFDQSLENNQDFDQWMDEFNSILTTQLFEEAFMIMRVSQFLEDGEECAPT